MASGAELVAAARSRLGDPYVYGATGPDTFDCSGLVQWAGKQIGVSLPRTSQEQWKVGTPVTADQLQPGDLVFSAGSDGSAASPGHVAIYAGDGQVIVAPHTGASVRVQPLAQLSPTGYRRPPGLAAGAGSADGGGVVDAGLTGNLFSLPGEIVGFFSKATDDLTGTADFLRAFFQPSTYVRIGAGFFGVLLVIAGLFFIAREARSGE